MPQPRRPGELGVHSVDHVNFAVPDLGKAQAFHAGFGLDVREEEQGPGRCTFGHEHRWGHVHEEPAKKLGCVSFGICPEDIGSLRARAIHGSDHATIAPARSSGPGLLHLTWDVGSMDRGWEAADHPGHGASHVWGPAPPADFATNHGRAG